MVNILSVEDRAVLIHVSGMTDEETATMLGLNLSTEAGKVFIFTQAYTTLIFDTLEN
jgi:hypothetical protein